MKKQKQKKFKLFSYLEKNNGTMVYRLKLFHGSKKLKQICLNVKNYSESTVEEIVSSTNSHLHPDITKDEALHVFESIVNSRKIQTQRNNVNFEKKNNSFQKDIAGERVISVDTVIKEVLAVATVKVESSNLDTLPDTLQKFSNSFKAQGFELSKSKVVYDPANKKSKIELNFAQDVGYKVRQINNNHIHYVESGETMYKYMVLYDIHIPYHKPEYVYGLIDYAKENGYYGIILGGDLVDQEYMSNYTISQKVLGIDYVQNQINAAGDLIKYIESKKFKRMIFLEGNHDERICRNIFGANISGKGVKKYGTELDFYSLGSLLSFDPAWEYGYYKDSVMIGDWKITHGDEHNKSLNPDLVKGNVLVGHTHRVNHVTNSFRFDGVRYTYQEIRVGCLLDLKSGNVPRMNDRQIDTWVNGFAILTTDGRKTYVNNCIIDTSDDSTCIDGQFIYLNKKR